MQTLTRIIELQASGNLTGDALSGNLIASEGRKGSEHIKSLGHPLQHIAILDRTSPGSFNELGTTYHERGPVRYPKGGPNVGIPKAQGISAHSQFSSQQQAQSFIAMALSSSGGVKALKLLKDPKYTIKLTYGLAKGIHATSRSAHAVSDPATSPTHCFVLVEPTEFDSIVLELHQSKVTLEGLHFQSAYPSKTGTSAGTCVLEITTHPGKTKMTKTFTS